MRFAGTTVVERFYIGGPSFTGSRNAELVAEGARVWQKDDKELWVPEVRVHLSVTSRSSSTSRSEHRDKDRSLYNTAGCELTRGLEQHTTNIGYTTFPYISCIRTQVRRKKS